MTKIAPINYGMSLQAVRESYRFFQRVEAGPGFYSRVTYFSAERTALQASLPQGLERKMEQGYRRPQVIDTSIVNRIAPREKPRAYSAEETGYLRPAARPVNRIKSYDTPVNRIQAYQDTQKPTNRLRQYDASQQDQRKTNRVSGQLTSPNYEMLDSNLPNDFYLTPKDIALTIARNNEKDKDNTIDKMLEPLTAKQCRRCNTPIILGELCNRCMTLN